MNNEKNDKINKLDNSENAVIVLNEKSKDLKKSKDQVKKKNQYDDLDDLII